MKREVLRGARLQSVARAEPRPHAARAMDVLPMCGIFQELQIVHETGYFSALPSLEEYWQQVSGRARRVLPRASGFDFGKKKKMCF